MLLLPAGNLNPNARAKTKRFSRGAEAPKNRQPKLPVLRGAQTGRRVRG